MFPPARRSGILFGAAALGLSAGAQLVIAAPPVGGPFLVFLDSNASALDQRAADILDSAAEQLRSLDRPRILITGHTDSAGSAGPNMELARRRAAAVQSHLGRRGVPAGAIRTVAWGETRLLVETADDVAEPQNRRVEVTLEQEPR